MIIHFYEVSIIIKEYSKKKSYFQRPQTTSSNPKNSFYYIKTFKIHQII